MKNYFSQLRALLVLATVGVTVHLASAAETVSLSASPAVMNVNVGTALAATTVTITYTISGGSTAVNFATSLPATPTGLSVSALSKTSDTVSGTLTFTVSTTTSTPAGAYTIDFNASGGASASIPILVVIGPEWTGGGADLNWNTSGNWSFAVNSASVVNFNQGKVGGIGVVNNIVSASITVNSLGYTFGTTGGSGYEVTQISPSQTLTVAENVTVGLDNVTTHVVMTNTGNFTVTGDASSFFSVGAGNSENATKQTAVLVLADGANTINTASLWVGDSGGNNGNSGNVLSLGNGNNTINADSIIVAHGKASGTLNFNGATVNGGNGTVTIRNRAGTGRANITLGNGSSGSGASTGALSLAGHSADIKAGTLTIASVGNTSGNQVGTATLDTGTLDATSIILCSTTSGSGNATGTLTFGGSATPNAATLIVNSAGGGSFVISDANRGTQTGNGTFNLNTNSTAQVYCSITKVTAANNTGTINITGGTLVMESAANSIGTPAIPIDALNLTNANIHLNLNGAAIATNIVATTVTEGGTTAITIDSVSGVTGSATFPLISYTGTDPFPGLASVALPGGYSGSLIDNSASHRIDLNLASTTPSLVWVGATNSVLVNNWDTSTTNWLNAAVPAAYADPDNVQFDDTASNSTVTLLATISPTGVIVSNNTLNYAFGGSGIISGATSLTKTGSGSLILTESGGDNFSGGLTLNNGTLVVDNDSSAITGGLTVNAGTAQIGANDTSGVLPSGAVGITGGTLAFNRSDSITVGNVIAGSAGALAQVGTNVVTLSGANTYGGPTFITNGGAIKVTGFSALGALPGGAVTISNGGTLDLSGITSLNASGGFGAKQFFVAGAGMGGNGALVNNFTNQQNAFEKITLTADATFGGLARFDLRGGTPTLDLGGHNLTKTGPNQVSIVGATLTGGGGSIEIGTGIFSVETTSTFSGSGSITVDNGGTLGMRTTTSTFTWPITLNAGSTIRNTGATAANFSTITLAGNATLDANSQSTTLNGVISSPGGAYGLTKIGTSNFVFTATNTYTGPTAINAGALVVGASGSISNSTPISVGGSGNFDVSAVTGGFHLAAGQTLMGSGTNLGAVTIDSGATLQPGFGGTDTSTLNFNNTLALAGTTLMALNRTNAQTASKVSGVTTLTRGGTLTVANVGPALQSGDTFTLFSAAGASGNFNATNLPALGPGQNWWTPDNYATLTVNQLSAGDVTYTRFKDVSLKIAISDLLTNAASVPAGGDTFFLAALGASTNGAAITTNSTYIFFSSTNNLAESFGYTVTDARGGSAAGTITINVTSAVGVMTITNNVGGSVTVGFYGIPGYQYVIQRSPDLSAWENLVTNMAPDNGLIQYTDTPPYNPAFYRTAQP